MDKFEALAIWNNFINGSIDDFKCELKCMKKARLLQFIYFIVDEFEGSEEHYNFNTSSKIIAIIYEVLE